ncbi:MAG: adaptor protein MecA [Firmicutes bacterium]|nr:adaptor protein MecA [Bacillota bacterium]
MRVERINDNQIKFEFMAQDLAERDINISDIVNPSANKTHGLFREITGLLQTEYGFATIGTPLVFEATMSHDTLCVIVTRMVNDHGYGANDGMSNLQNILSNYMSQLETYGEHSDEVQSFLDSVPLLDDLPLPRGGRRRPACNAKPRVHKKKPESGYAVFAFDNFDMLAAAASRIPESYKGRSHVYKLRDKYQLILQNVGIGEHSAKKFTAQLSEFGQKQKSSVITYNQIMEHGEVIIAEDAINKLKIYHGV